MIKISICIGSSCHLKGSYDVINIFKNKIEELSLNDKIEINASFCLGHCAKGVAVKVNNGYLDEVNAGNASEIFDTKILPLL